MKIAGAFVLAGLLALASAEWIDIDWSQVKHIDEFDHYWQRLPAEWQRYRTAVPSHRIVNGVEALPGQFPYQIALLSNFGTGTGLCGGTVITNNYILTAAHCVVGGSGLAIDGTAILGAHDRTVVEPTQQRIAFSQAGIAVHPGYDSSTIRNDIATVRLNTPAVFNARVQPIDLPARSDSRTFAGLEGTASGFGRTSDALPGTSPVVMFTRNPILSNAACNSFWSTALVQDQNVCLDAAGGRSPCNGDSGGPLAVQDAGNSLEVGIASFVSAQGCASGAPSVWVRISFFRDWIEQNSDYVFRALEDSTMKATLSVLALLAVCLVASAEWIDIDWSQVKPIDEFDHYWQRLPAELQILRHARPAHRIVNGVEALPGQFPYQIALLSTFVGGGSGLCGGSVITNNYILTAAHCVVDGNGALATEGTAILGAHDRTVNEPSQQRISFSQSGVFVHPSYNPTLIRNDIATVRLNTPAVFNDRVQPIDLPALSDDRTFAGLEGTASGFGRTSDALPGASPVIMFTRNPVMSNAACVSAWNIILVSDQNVCLDATGGRSVCNGDSGGPLSVQDGGNSLEVGIASFVSAQGCASGIPSVWVRVSFYRDFIAQNSDYEFRA
ncbi:transmembrane protease serine 9-like [Anopheles nili]|uniref:transmembrane protease serine 9-like n=1 Tax=Anopheles nili TaxID=185578 RepID=UPI00237C18E1|nr:transmembrane protease serine 9-like [Anopheles nili]